MKPKWENTNMEEGVLYLVIVNDPETELSKPGNPLGLYTYPTNNSVQHASSMMQQSQTSGSHSSKASFYNPVYDEPRGAPPAYSETHRR